LKKGGRTPAHLTQPKGYSFRISKRPLGKKREKEEKLLSSQTEKEREKNPHAQIATVLCGRKRRGGGTTSAVRWSHKRRKWGVSSPLKRGEGNDCGCPKQRKGTGNVYMSVWSKRGKGRGGLHSDETFHSRDRGGGGEKRGEGEAPPRKMITPHPVTKKKRGRVQRYRKLLHKERAGKERSQSNRSTLIVVKGRGRAGAVLEPRFCTRKREKKGVKVTDRPESLLKKNNTKGKKGRRPLRSCNYLLHPKVQREKKEKENQSPRQAIPLQPIRTSKKKKKKRGRGEK